MGKFSVPDNIRSFKPKGSIVKLVHNKYYYVYEHFNKKVDGKWKTVSGKLLGYIDSEKGFISNTSYIVKESITTYEYGQYAIAIANSKNTLNKLLRVFNTKNAYTIYLISIIHIVNGFVHLKDLHYYIEQSYISLLHKDISLSYHNVSSLLDDLGRKQNKVFDFEQLLINESSKEIAIDGHDIRSTSHENDLAELGNKFNVMKDMQLNVLMAYDINTNIPILSRIYPGSILDKTSVSNLLEFNEFKNILFIIDRGFYSETNIELFSSNNNHYIIPLAMNLKTYKEVTKDMNFHDIFIYEKNKKTTPIEYKEVILENNTKIIICRDLVQSVKEKEDYLNNIEKYPDKYTKESYEIVEKYFGVIVLQTNLGSSCKDIYALYKKRWRIETFFNYFKNGIDINALGIQGYYSTQGLSFIMLIVGIIYCELTEAVKEVKGKSLEDCLLDGRSLKLNHRNKAYAPSVIKKSTQELFKTLGIDATKSPI